MCPLVLLDIATKAAEITARDPHGLILTVVCVSVVFAALLILFLCYSLIGKICQDAEKRTKAGKGSVKSSGGKDASSGSDADDEESLIAAAVSIALGDYISGEVHDNESYVITIRR